MPMFSRHPEVVLDGLCSKLSETGREVVPEWRSVTSRIGKKSSGKTLRQL